MTLDPVAVYVHIPFCAAKCGYCDFNSHALSGPIVERTVQATLKEIRRSPLKGRPATTVFFGGGTPSLIPAEFTASLLEAVLEVHPPLGDIEATFEANPESAAAEKLSSLKKAGFNRASIGVQSFNPAELVRLERVHSAEQAFQAFDNARAAGFTQVNLDLMFGLEGQSVQVWTENLNKALQLGPEHLSLYNLTIEQGTRFATQYRQGRLRLPDEEVQAEMYRLCTELLSPEGYVQYEISNYAKPGCECRHNLWVWRGGDYVGYGPGAVGCAQIDGKRVRRTNTKNPAAFCRKVEIGEPAWQEEETIDVPTQEFERIMLGLRLNEGLPTESLKERPVAAAVQKGWLERVGGRVRLTAEGRLFCNDAVLLFLDPQ